MTEKLKKKAARRVNKLLIGMVIGGAIGSVVGATITKNTGEENRKILKDKSKLALEKGKQFIEEHKEDFEEIKSKKKTFWHFLNKYLVKDKDENQDEEK